MHNLAVVMQDHTCVGVNVFQEHSGDMCADLNSMTWVNQRGAGRCAGQHDVMNDNVTGERGRHGWVSIGAMHTIYAEQCCVLVGTVEVCRCGWVGSTSVSM